MIDSRGGSEPRAAERSLPSMPVRVTRGELERWRAAAAARGLTLSAWVRSTLDLVAEMAEAGAALRASMEEQRKPLLPPAEPARVPVASGQLRRNGEGVVWMVEGASATMPGTWVLSRWETGYGRRWLHGMSEDGVSSWTLVDEPAQRDTLPAPPGDE